MSHSHLNELFEQGLLWQAESVSSMERSHEPCGSGPSPDQPGLPDLPYSPGKEKTKSAVPFGVQEIDAVLPFNGLLRGGLHEFFYEDQKAANAGKKRNARDEKRSQPLYVLPGWIAAQALLNSAPLPAADAPGKIIIWIGRNTWPTPFLLEQLGKIAGGSHATTPARAGERGHEAPPLDVLGASFFADPPDRKLKLWALETALRSSATAAVITECDRLNFKLTQRLTLAAEEGLNLAIIMRPLKERETPSAALTRWLITPAHGGRDSGHADIYSRRSRTRLDSARHAEKSARFIEPRRSCALHSFEPAAAGTASSCPRWKVELLKCKGRQPPITSWIVELQDEEKLSLHIPADVVNRSAEDRKSKIA